MVLAGKDGVLYFLELDDSVDAPPEHEAETTGILTNQSAALGILFESITGHGAGLLLTTMTAG